ncbi:MAG: hemerythrin domain-containing protein, partial [Kiritimatiellae bacterium]|nr:hemerythrin domain-containing protein [Kiritimatiellia bacterium]
MNIDRAMLSTGIPLIDRQHAEYADLVDKLFAMAHKGGVNRQILSVEVDAVIKYAVEHFDAEECLMRSENYPAFAEHSGKHNVFRVKTDSLVAEWADGLDTDAFTIRLSRWLIEWFCDQVQNDDRKLAIFLTRLRDQK